MIYSARTRFLNMEGSALKPTLLDVSDTTVFILTKPAQKLHLEAFARSSPPLTFHSLA